MLSGYPTNKYTKHCSSRLQVTSTILFVYLVSQGDRHKSKLMMRPVVKAFGKHVILASWCLSDIQRVRSGAKANWTCGFIGGGAWFGLWVKSRCLLIVFCWSKVWGQVPKLMIYTFRSMIWALDHVQMLVCCFMLIWGLRSGTKANDLDFSEAWFGLWVMSRCLFNVFCWCEDQVRHKS